MNVNGMYLEGGSRDLLLRTIMEFIC